MLACTRKAAELAPIHLADNAPEDRPLRLSNPEQVYAALEPCRIRAMQSFPDVKTRFRSGLGARQTLFVVTRLYDSASRTEQVFVAVDSIRPDSIVGRLASELHAVTGFQYRQRLAVHETQVVDWMISMPDGAEEGNLMGKFLDAWQVTGRASTSCTGAA